MSSLPSTAQYLTFAISDEAFAVELSRVREVIPYPPLTRVPSLPRCISGVANLRGTVIPVIDLAAKFGFASVAPGKRTCLVIIEPSGGADALILGVIADRVDTLVDLSSADIEPAPTFGMRVKLEFLQGLAKVDSGFVPVLDLERVLAPEELLSLEELRLEDVQR